MKRVKWLGTSLNAVREFPADARALMGQELRLVQAGEMPSDFKPMLTIGAGVYEIRVKVLGEWRVLYVAKFAPAIYVLHAFVKKTPKTSQPDLDTAKSRYAALLKEIRS